MATVPNIMDSLKKAVTNVFKCECVECEITTNDLTDKYSSEHWLSRFDLTGKRISRRFDYGLLDIHLQVFNGMIVDVQINSDLMDVEIIDQIKDNLISRRFDISLLEMIDFNHKVVQADLIKMIADEFDRV